MRGHAASGRENGPGGNQRKDRNSEPEPRVVRRWEWTERLRYGNRRKRTAMFSPAKMML
jgi:hypothetical protein